MLILIDESLPRRLRRALPGHEVFTVQQRGWSGMKNGLLISTAQRNRFDVFVTADRNIIHQQNLASTGLRIIVVAARSNRFADVEPLTHEILTAISDMHPGEIRVIPKMNFVGTVYSPRRQGAHGDYTETSVSPPCSP